MLKKFELFSRKGVIEYILLSLILILGFAVRLYKIDNPVADWHSWRQADTASVSRIYVEKGINLLYPRYHDISSIQSKISNPNGYRMVEFPVYNAVNALLAVNFKFLSLEEWGRLITIFSAIITSFFLYLIGKRLMGTAGGILSAFFYLFIPFNIYFTRVILPDPMGVTFAVISLWAFLKFADEDKGVFFYLSTVFFALAMLIKPYLGFYLVPIMYLAGEKKVLKKTFYFFVIAFVPFVAWRIWESRFPEGIPLFTWAFNGDAIRFRPAFFRWIFGERLGKLILGIWGLILFVFGVLKPKGKNSFINWFLLGALFYVVVVATANVKHDYYQILTIPAISLALASGTIFLWTNTFFSKTLSRILVAFSILMMLMVGWEEVKGNYMINHWEIIDAGREIDRITAKDALIIAPYSGDTAFLYQTNRSGWPVVDDSIDHIIQKGADYYVSVDLTSTDTLNFQKMFATVKETNAYIILDLHQRINTK